MQAASGSTNETVELPRPGLSKHIAYLYVIEEAIPDYSDEAPTSIYPQRPCLIPILLIGLIVISDFRNALT
jgi:hypothetical protein